MIQAVNMQKMSVGIPRNKINQKSRSTQPNFKGAPTGDIDKLIEKELFAQSKGLKAMNWIDKNMSENMKTCINAIGTAGIAPLMIIYNPLSKKDKDGRKYSALRQPVSAFTAITLGAISGGTFEAWVKKAAAMGKLGNSLNTSTEFLAKNPHLANGNKANVKALGTIVSMLGGLLVMPFQAKVLNLLYPPFAKKVAPDLVKRIENKKTKKETPKAEGGTK